jgi:hypothetical protein
MHDEVVGCAIGSRDFLKLLERIDLLLDQKRAVVVLKQDRAGSPVPVLGYTPAYPVANILLTTWGSIIVVVFAA